MNIKRKEVYIDGYGNEHDIDHMDDRYIENVITKLSLQVAALSFALETYNDLDTFGVVSSIADNKAHTIQVLAERLAEMQGGS